MADTDVTSDPGSTPSPAAFEPSQPFTPAPAPAPPAFDPGKPFSPVAAAPAFDATKPSTPAEQEPLRLVPGQTTQDEIDAARGSGRGILVPGETAPRKAPPPEQVKPEDVISQQGWDLSGYAAPPAPPSRAKSFVRGAVSGAGGAGGGLAGFGAGAAAGAEIGAFGGPLAEFTVPAGALLGGIVGSFAGGWLGDKAEEKVVSMLPKGAQEAIGQSPEQIAAAQEAHPYMYEAGGLAPNLLAFSPSAAGHAATEGASTIERLMAHPVTARAVPAAVMAAQDAVQHVAEGQPIDPGSLALAAGAGALMQRETALGRALIGAGAKPLETVFGHIRGAPEAIAAAAQPQPAPAAPEGATTAPPADVASRAMAVADQLEASGQTEAAARLRAQYPQPEAETQTLPATPPNPEATQPTPMLLPAPDVVYGPQGWEQRGGGLVPPQSFTMQREGAAQPTALDQLKETAASIGNDARARQAQPVATTDQQLAGAEQRLQQEAQPSRQPLGQQLIQGITEPGRAPPGNPAIAPQSTPQATIPAPPGPNLNYRPIRNDQAVIPSSGAAFPVTYGVADAHDLVTSHHDDLSPNQNYPQALQPRSRERAETEVQLSSILNGGNLGQFRPELLGEGADAANGAPIVGEDGLVEGGNARTMAIRRAYDRGLPQAEEYRQYLASQGYPVDGMAAPMLVRVNKAGMDMPQREQLARDLNVPAQAAMSSSDQAMADAVQIEAQQLRSYQGGDIFSGANQPFLVGLMRGLVRPNELPALLNPEGGLSPAGRTRIRNALLAKAYGDSGVVSTLTEDADNNIKSIGNALTDAAPSWARMRDVVASGHIPVGYDLTSPVLDAVRLISHARDTGRNVAEFVSQRGMFGDGVTPETEGILSWMLGAPDFTRRYSREKISDALSSYADSVSALGPNLLEARALRPLEMVENARQNAQGAAGDLFAQPVEQPGSASALRQDAGAGSTEAQRPGPPEAGVVAPAGGAEPVAEPAQRPAESAATPAVALPAATEPASAQASGEGKTTGLPAGEPAGANPQIRLADWISRQIANDTLPDAKFLLARAEHVYGGKLAEGKFTRADLYDAMELGVNRYIREHPDNLNPNDNVMRARAAVERLRKLKEDLPTQTVRAGEKETHQQFSTPPDYAYAAVRAAGIRPTDRVIEPSAGTGSLVAHAMNAHPAEVITNEISPQRSALVESLRPNRAFHENAEQLHNILPNDVRPTVAVMNPPFSATAGRMGDRTDITVGAKHIEQALARLEPGGRLVAIVGSGMRPYDENAPVRVREGTGSAFRDWWQRIGSQYDVRANIGVSGDVYKKYGTNFGTRLVIIDKVPPSGRPLVTGDVENTYDLVNRLEDVRNDRPARNPGQQVAPQPGGAPLAPASEGRPGPSATLPRSAPSPGVREGAAGPGPGRPVQGEFGLGSRETAQRQARPSEGNAAVQRQPERSSAGRAEPESRGAVDVSQELGTSGAAPNGDLVRPQRGDESVLSVGGERASLSPAVRIQEAAADPATGGEITENVYEQYRPQRITFEGAKAHPSELVQSAAMASVMPPRVDYTPQFERGFVEKGLLSDAQLEAVTYAGHAHLQMLPALEDQPQTRRGYFVGDGTGVGKGREVSGIILDNWNQGRQKHVWVSEKRPLIADARRDWSGLGQDQKHIFDVSKTNAGDRLGVNRGIAFTTYDTLRSGEKATGETKGKTRIDQLAEWLGKDFDGVIAFDEAHNMGNALAQKGTRGIKDPSQKALAGVELQKRLPNARVVYVSATGATEVSNLAYADRLGLWGHGTAFASKQDFIGKIAEGGVAAMELVARDMKAMGSYIARNLSYNGVEYDRLQHTLQPHDRAMYDKLAQAWQITLHNFSDALELTGASKDGRAKSAAASAYWGGHQRFFNQILTSLQMPTIIKGIEGDLAERRQAVVQLVNTNEASLDRALAKRSEEGGEDLEDLDLSPKDQLMQLVEHSFPTQKYERYLDDEGDERSRPVQDSEGNPVQDREAVAMRERLLDELGAISAPDGPLEMLLNHFGVDQVAEVTGRKQRVVNRSDEDGNLRKVRESRPASANETEGNAFQAGKKRVLVFSSAGGTGRSYHADNTSASAGARRSHYLAQPGWRADTAIQGFGRTHRTNQASAPLFHLVTTDLQGQRRFISSIARRLAQLGALTKGERRTGDQGLFNARDNLESPEARDALYRFFRDLFDQKIEGMGISEFEQETGLKLLTPEGNLRRDLPDIPQFLNRLLSMTIDRQNNTFNEFDQRLTDAIDNAAARGTLDTGLETLRADRLTKQHESVVYTDPKSGAETKYVRLSMENRNRPRGYDDVMRPSLTGKQPNFFVTSNRSGKAFAVSDTSAVTDPKTGAVIEQYRLTHPLGYEFIERYKIDGWDSKKYWTRVNDPAQARAAWDASVAKIPEFNKRDLHLITGAVLPIWDRLNGRPRVYRLQTTDTGERLLGRQIPDSDVAGTLQRLGAGQEGRTYAPSDVVSRVLDGEQAKLANGWSVIRSYVAGQPRIEVRGPSYPDMERMRQTGLFNERIQFSTRFFIPTGDQAETVTRRLIEQHPVVDLSGDAALRESVPEGWSHAETRPEQPAPQSMIDEFQAFHGTDYPQTSLGYHGAARDWTLERGHVTGHEHIVAYDDEDGRVTYAGTNGSPTFVGLPESALHAGANLIIHHNHPGNGALSTDDISALAFPGISRIIAHAQNGDLFSAELTSAAKEWMGSLSDVDTNEAYKTLRRTIAATAQPIREALESTVRSGQLDRQEAAHIGHDILGRALDAAGLIHYVSSRDLAPLSPSVVKNLIAEGATSARLIASFQPDRAVPRFVPDEDLNNAVLDRSASVVGPDEAMARAFGPTQDIASGRYLGEELGGGRGAGIGEAETDGAGRPLVGGLREESDLPDDAARLAQEHEEAGHRALAAGDTDAAMQYFSSAAQARAGGGGQQPPGEPPEPPVGGQPPQGPMSPIERKAALDRIMHTDDTRWMDQVRDTVKNLREQPGLKFRQYWQDNLAALEVAEKGAFGGGLAPGRISPTMSARFARNWHSTLDVALNHNQVRYNPDTGVIEPIEGSKPFREILRPLGEDQKASGRNTVQDFALWSIVQRAERLAAEGKERNVPSDIITRARDIDQEYTNPDDSNLFHQVHDELQQWHSNLLDLGEAGGLINHDSRALWEHNDYVPFYRALEDSVAAPGAGARGIVNARSPIKQLLGSEAKVNNIYENMVMNAAAMVRRSMANIAAQKARDLLVEHTAALTPMSKDARAVFGDPAVQASLRAAGIDPAQMTAQAKQGAADLFGALRRRDPDTISVMDNGKANFYRVNDPLLLQSVTAAGPATMTGLGRLLTAPARLLRGAVIFDPAFMLAHNLRMAQHAYILTGTNPVRSITAAMRQAKGIDPVAMKLMAAGAMSGKYDLDLPRNVRTQIASPEYQATLIDTPLKAARMMRNFSEQAMQAADIGPRIAVYQRGLSQGMSEAEALNHARDLLDFSTRGGGGAAMFLAQTIPFLNARWQGMARTYRGFMGSDRNGILLRGALVTAASLALWAENKDDPEYQRKEDWDRQYAWQIKVAPDTWFRLPKPFELGALFGTVPEIIADYLDNGSSRTMGNATGAMFANVFKFNPIPVAVRPVLEAWWNHDSYTGQPIVNEREAALEPDLQYGPTDSASIVGLTHAFNSVSPVEASPAIIQHLLRGYLAGWGTYISSASDYLGEQAGILPATPSAAEPLVVGRFVHTEPEPSNRLMSDFYDLKRQIGATGQSLREAEKNQDTSMIATLQGRHPEYSAAIEKGMNRVGTELSKVRGAYQRIEMNPTMSADQKTTARDNYYLQRDRLLDSVKPLLRQAEGLSAQSH